MKRAIAFLASLLAIALLTTVASAAVISEESLKDMGYDSFSLEGADSNGCFSFKFAKDLNQNTKTHYTVFSINAEFLPVPSANANIAVFLNDQNAMIVSAKDFENNWYRLTLPREALKEANDVKACLQTAQATTRIKLSNDSMAGTYKMPELRTEGFLKTPNNYMPLIREEFTITVTLENFGSEAVDVNLLHKKPEIDYEPAAIIRGQTNKIARIPAGGKIEMQYTMKARKPTMMTLPAAAAYYTNIFGEKKRVVSNYPIVYVREPEIKITPVVLALEKQKKGLGEETRMQLAVKNSGQDPIYDIAVFLQAPNGIVLSETEMPGIPAIRPAETKYFNFSAKAVNYGRFQLGCKLAYQDYNVTETNCENLVLDYPAPGIPIAIVSSIVLVAIAVGIYLYIYFK
jgi:hypothetical protein